jgi:hypothetical protein
MCIVYFKKVIVVNIKETCFILSLGFCTLSATFPAEAMKSWEELNQEYEARKTASEARREAQKQESEARRKAFDEKRRERAAMQARPGAQQTAVDIDALLKRFLAANTPEELAAVEQEIALAERNRNQNM